MRGEETTRTERGQRLRDQAEAELNRRWEVFRAQHPEVRFPDFWDFDLGEDNIEALWIMGLCPGEECAEVPVGVMPVFRLLPTVRRTHTITYYAPNQGRTVRGAPKMQPL